jgi:hypothetical protein
MEAVAAACLALEADVIRAAALAKDLNIPRQPLTVSAPAYARIHVRPSLSLAQPEGKIGKPSLASKIVPRLTENSEERAFFFLLWKGVVTLSAYIVFWYYSYQFAFGNHTYRYLDYVAHLFDLIFFVDFIIDMCLISVHLPQSTNSFYNKEHHTSMNLTSIYVESLDLPCEILCYRVKTCYFWIRLVSFLPFEYVLGPITGWSRGKSLYYYTLKFNRLFACYEVHLHVYKLETSNN